MDYLEITLNKIKNKRNLDDSFFLPTYGKLIKGEDLTEEEKFYILKVALFFLNSKEESVERFGYRIILRYSNQFRDYQPLHDVALSREYIPIAKFAENKYLRPDGNSERFSDLYVISFQENFKIEGDTENIYRSKGQMVLNRFSAIDEDIAVIAPTSYGKSEMLIKKIPDYIGKKICIIVPSKALLAQTKRLLLKSPRVKEGFKKIITHPDMFKESDNSFLAVLTQERLLRLLQRNKELSLDLVLIDEAHNILEDTDRAHLLAQVLLILQKRNSDFIANFFTPFLADIKSLSIVNHNTDIIGKPVTEFMKIEKFFTYDVEKAELNLYDQFLDKYFPINCPNFANDIDFIINNKSTKNIVYLNRPVTVEEFALKIAERAEPITLTPEIEKIIESISGFIHEEYNLIKCLKKGVLYHHGGIPDIIRLYIENIYSKYSEFNFIITTSTLLEGVNIPADKIFLLSPKKGMDYLSPAQFKNLIGRVCRFKEVFNYEKGDLRMLEPEIYVVNGSYAPKNFALLSFYKNRVNARLVIEDEVENPLLENSTKKEKTESVLEYLENMEPGSSGLEDVLSPTSIIGQLCFINNVHDFSIIENESKLVTNLNYYTELHHPEINSAEALIGAITNIFFEGITLSDKSESLTRIKEHQEARNFYSMFIGWRTKGSPYPLMIGSFLKYWQKNQSEGKTLVYIGSKWGELTGGGGYQKLYVNMVEKNEVQRINLAIAKIKEEQEFVDFNILKYLEILKELSLVESSFYDQVKYGTSNVYVICLLKNGFSMELSKMLVDKYSEFLEFDLEQDYVHYDELLVSAMSTNKENEVLMFEIDSNL